MCSFIGRVFLTFTTFQKNAHDPTELKMLFTRKTNQMQLALH